MADEYQELTLKEREKLHEDIERIRHVLQTDDTSDLYCEDDEEDEPHVDEAEIGQIGEEANASEVLFTSLNETSASDAAAPVQESSTGISQEEDVDLSHFEYGDELPANAAVALALNRAYQEVIEENLKRVKLVLIHNRERQSQLEQEIQHKGNEDIYSNDCFKKKLLTVYTVPYFKDVHGMFPPNNEDTLKKKASEEMDPFIKPPKTFLTDQVDKLREAVTADAKEKLMIPLVNKKEILCEKLFHDGDNDTLKDAIRDIDGRVQEIHRLPLLRLLEQRGDQENEIDWMKISTIDFEGTRSSEDLERSWKNFAHPAINTKKFKGNEDTRLMQIAEKHQFRNWDQIAAELGTQRTAFQCLQRYQMKLNLDLKTGKWTTDEDDILKEVVEQCRLQNGQIDWTHVSYFMDGRSNDMCQERWRFVDPYGGMKKGRWTEEEDLKLLTAVQVYGQQWAKMGKFVPGRTGIQIRERYYNAFENNKKGDWTYEEDRFIWQHVVENGPRHWSLISKQLENRSDNAVHQRYKRLLKWGELATTLGYTKVDSDDIFLKHKIKDIRLEVPNTAKTMQGAEYREQQNKKSSSFLDQTIMFHEGNVNLKSEGKSKNLSNKITKELKKFEQQKGLEDLMKPNKSLEEKQAEKELNDKIEKDIKQGIFIPRPPPGVEGTRQYCAVLEERINMQNRMKTIIAKSVLKNCRMKEEQLTKNIDEVFQGHHSKEMYVAPHMWNDVLQFILLHQQIFAAVNVPPISTAFLVKSLEILDQVRIKSVGKMLTVKEILDLSTSIKSKVLKTHGINETASKKVDDSETIEEKIGEIANSVKLYTPGSLRNTIQDKKSLHTVPKQTEEMKSRVSKLMLAALNIDVKGCITSAEKIKSGSCPSSWGSQDVYESSQEKVDKNIAKLSSIANTPIRKLKLDQSAREETNQENRKSVPRLKALTGDAAAVYKIPPLPPNCGTLNAFKQMLLHRKKLVNIAGRFHLPGSLTTGKRESKEITSQPATDSQKKSGLEKVLPSIPRSQLQENARGESILEPVSLSGQFMTRELLAAHKIIQSKNITELKEGSMTLGKFQEVTANISQPTNKEDRPKLKAIERLRKTHDYHLLNSRFLSTFLWPALQSTISIDRFVIEKPTTPGTYRNKKMKYFGKRKRKRGKRNKVKEEEITPEKVDSKKSVLNEVAAISGLSVESNELNTDQPSTSKVTNSAQPPNSEGPAAATGEPPKRGRGRPKGGGKDRFMALKATGRSSTRDRRSATTLVISDEINSRKRKSKVLTKATKNTALRDAILDGYERPPSKKIKRRSVTNVLVQIESPEFEGINIKGEREWSGDESYEEDGVLAVSNNVQSECQDTAMVHHQQDKNIPLNNDVPDLNSLCPCIMVGNQLIPLSHPLLEGFIQSVKAMSNQQNAGLNVDNYVGNNSAENPSAAQIPGQLVSDGVNGYRRDSADSEGCRNSSIANDDDLNGEHHLTKSESFRETLDSRNAQPSVAIVNTVADGTNNQTWKETGNFNQTFETNHSLNTSNESMDTTETSDHYESMTVSAITESRNPIPVVNITPIVANEVENSSG